MEFGSSLPLLAGALLCAGGVAGLLAGLLGVGGGVVMVPALYQTFELLGVDHDLGMRLAVGTSLACIIPTSISSIRAHVRRGAVDVGLLKGWAPWVCLGTIAGSLIAGHVRGPVLTGLFGSFAACVALHLSLTPERARLADHPPVGPLRAAIGTVIGAISAMVGIGGGSLTVPTLSVTGVPMRTAVGTSAAVGFVIALPGALGFMWSGWGTPGLPALSLGYVSLLGLAVITPTGMLTAPLGARLAHTVPPRALRRFFALFLGIMATRMLWGAFA